MTSPVIIVHGGSGKLEREIASPEQLEEFKQGLKVALLAAAKVLSSGGNALDAASTAVACLEDNYLFNAGRGAVYNIVGDHEMEASVCVSDAIDNLPQPRKGAGVTLLKHVRHPILLAKELYLDETACPHAFLSGADAERIAIEKGLEMKEARWFDTEARWKEHKRGLKELEAEGEALPDYQPLFESKGTVGAVALDDQGRIAAATSTGGKTNKNVGRIGDSPVIGAGCWSEQWNVEPSMLSRVKARLGMEVKPIIRKVGISGTGEGDYYVRKCAAHEVGARMRLANQSLQKASSDVIAELLADSAEGGMICLAEDGTYSLPLNCSGMFRGVLALKDGIPLVAVWKDDELQPI